MTGPIHLTTGVWSFTPPRVTEKKDSRQPDSEKRRVGGCEVKSGMEHKRNFTALQLALDMPASDEALRHPYTYTALGSIRDGGAGLALGVCFQDENFD